MRLKRSSQSIIAVILLSFSLISALAPLDFNRGRLSSLARLKAELVSPVASLTELGYRAALSFRSLLALVPRLSEADELQRLRRQVSALEAHNRRLAYRLDLERRKQDNLRAFRGRLNARGAPADVLFYERDARVVAAEPSLYRKAVRINLGRKHGVREGMGVLWEDAVVGRIKIAGRSTSVVELLVDPDFRAIARVGRERAEGIIEGSLYRTCRMRYVSADAKVKQGDVVYASGQFGFFPPGALVGRISNEPTEGRDGFLELDVKPHVDISRLLTVVVAMPEPVDHDS